MKLRSGSGFLRGVIVTPKRGIPALRRAGGTEKGLKRFRGRTGRRPAMDNAGEEG